MSAFQPGYASDSHHVGKESAQNHPLNNSSDAITHFQQHQDSYQAPSEDQSTSYVDANHMKDMEGEAANHIIDNCIPTTNGVGNHHHLHLHQTDPLVEFNTSFQSSQPSSQYSGSTDPVPPASHEQQQQSYHSEQEQQQQQQSYHPGQALLLTQQEPGEHQQQYLSTDTQPEQNFVAAHQQPHTHRVENAPAVEGGNLNNAVQDCQDHGMQDTPNHQQHYQQDNNFGNTTEPAVTYQNDGNYHYPLDSEQHEQIYSHLSSDTGTFKHEEQEAPMPSDQPPPCQPQPQQPETQHQQNNNHQDQLQNHLHNQQEHQVQPSQQREEQSSHFSGNNFQQQEQNQQPQHHHPHHEPPQQHHTSLHQQPLEQHTAPHQQHLEQQQQLPNQPNHDAQHNLEQQPPQQQQEQQQYQHHQEHHYQVNHFPGHEHSSEAADTKQFAATKSQQEHVQNDVESGREKAPSHLKMEAEIERPNDEQMQHHSRASITSNVSHTEKPILMNAANNATDTRVNPQNYLQVADNSKLSSGDEQQFSQTSSGEQDYSRTAESSCNLSTNVSQSKPIANVGIHHSPIEVSHMTPSSSQEEGSVVTSKGPEATEIYEPAPNDVLSGRGASVNAHPGNKKFRALCFSQKVLFDAGNYAAKRRIATEIMITAKTQFPARFLKRKQAKGPWFEMTKEQAINKACQVIRDHRRPDRIAQRGCATAVGGRRNRATATPMDDVIVPPAPAQPLLETPFGVHDHDVLCGRGAYVNGHSGNKRLRELAIKRKAQFDKGTYTEKRALAIEIVTFLKNLTPPGRFLRKVDPKKPNLDGKPIEYAIPPAGVDDGWIEVDMEKAIHKACQVMRDMDRLDRKHREERRKAKKMQKEGTLLLSAAAAAITSETKNATYQIGPMAANGKPEHTILVQAPTDSQVATAAAKQVNAEAESEGSTTNAITTNTATGSQQQMFPVNKNEVAACNTDQNGPDASTATERNEATSGLSYSII